MISFPGVRRAALPLAVLFALGCERPDGLLGPDRASLATTSALGVRRVEVTPDSLRLSMGGGARLRGVAFNAAGDTIPEAVIRWRSLDTTIVKVNSSGYVSARGLGSTLVVGTSESRSDTARVRVAHRVARAIIVPDSAVIPRGTNLRLRAVFLSAGGDTIHDAVPTWRTLTPTLVRVNAAGYATGDALGRGRVMLTSQGKSDTATIRVALPVAAVVISPDSAATLIGGTAALSAVLLDSAGRTLTDGRRATWRTLDSLLLRVDGSGLVTGLAAGRGRVVARGELRADTAWVRVGLPATPAIRDIAVSGRTVNTAAGAQTVTFTATASAASGISHLTFTFNGPSYSCTADPAGSPTTYRGSCSFTFPRWHAGSYPGIAVQAVALNGASTTVDGGALTVVSSAPVYLRNATLSDTLVNTATGARSVTIAVDGISAGGVDEIRFNVNGRRCDVAAPVAAPDSLHASCTVVFERWAEGTFPAQLQVNGRTGIAQGSAGDIHVSNDAPASVSITGVSARTLSTRNGPASVTLSASGASVAGVDYLRFMLGIRECRIEPATEAPDTLAGSCTITFEQGASGGIPVYAQVVARNGVITFAESGSVTVTN